MLDFIAYNTPIFYLIQSVWRDEAFSYFMAKPNILQVIVNTAHDFNPPLYYFLLHFWISVFGKTDIGLRFLSFLPHLGTSYVIYLLARRIFSKQYALFVSVFTLFNPMLLYYAFEIRMYSFYAFFTLCSLYFFHTRNWKWYTVTAVFGLYTHSFFPLILISYALYLKITHQSSRNNLLSTLKPLVFYAPWIPILLIQFRQSANSWMFPVDIQLIKSVLGNLLTNYEGTPGDAWGKTALLSLFICIFFILAYVRKKKQATLFLIPIFVPLLLILGFSMVIRPIYVNRYMIFVTVFEIMGITLGIWSIRNKVIRSLLMLLSLLLVFYIDTVMPPYKKKTDFRRTFMEINKIAKTQDRVYAKTPISFLESAYYYKYEPKVSVFIYNPRSVTIPNYIGTTVVFPNASQTSFPPAPSRVFLVDDDASFEMIINR